MGLIVGLIVFFLIKTQATPLSLLTRTDTVHTNLGEGAAHLGLLYTCRSEEASYFWLDMLKTHGGTLGF